MMALLWATSHCRPNVIVPRHNFETRRPVRPSLVWCIISPERALSPGENNETPRFSQAPLEMPPTQRRREPERQRRQHDGGRPEHRRRTPAVDDGGGDRNADRLTNKEAEREQRHAGAACLGRHLRAVG